MITEYITIQGLNAISLALTPTGRWNAARRPFSTASTAEGWLTAFAVVALIISVILVFWVISKRKDSERRLEQKIAKLTVLNEKLQQEIARLKQEQIDLLKKIIDAEPPRKKSTALNAQEIEALSELGKRLQ